ncbi:hypothetical protein [Halorussus caseinilyticus]|uniref:Uncharacterized protein n=1 Tax=Halorussus caseinilyticus TaxID=3034025 RepID=A0ABD5WQG8_9EURY
MVQLDQFGLGDVPRTSTFASRSRSGTFSSHPPPARTKRASSRSATSRTASGFLRLEARLAWNTNGSASPGPLAGDSADAESPPRDSALAESPSGDSAKYSSVTPWRITSV